MLTATDATRSLAPKMTARNRSNPSAGHYVHPGATHSTSMTALSLFFQNRS